MEARRNPEYLRSVARAVPAFRDAFTEFLDLHVVNKELARGIAPAVFPRDDAASDKIARLRAEVARAAGRASYAVPLTGSYMFVKGVGDKVDAIAAWQAITDPKPIVEPDNVLGICDQVLGRLDAMIDKAEAEAPPTVGAEAMHPLAWSAAARLWNDGHYRQAVAAAAENLVVLMKTRTNRNDAAETALWQEAFSDKAPVPGKPRLRWPGDPVDRDVKTMNDGLRQFAPGAQMTIRNTAAHGAAEFAEQAALERLAVLSLLARWVDHCELVEAPLEADGVVN